jgi:hypothetical protein
MMLDAAIIVAAGRMHCFARARNDKCLRQNSTTGKSLRIFRNDVKPGNQKYFRCPVGQISRLTSPVYRDKRGDRDRHDRAVGCDGREGCD